MSYRADLLRWTNQLDAAADAYGRASILSGFTLERATGSNRWQPLHQVG